MRILFFTDNLSAGGKERRLTELMKKISVKESFHFELILMNLNIHYKEVYDLNINIHYIIRKSKKDPSIFPKLYDICKKYKPDILHCWDSMTAIYSAPVCKILQIKLVNGMVIDSPGRQNILNKHWLRAKLTFPFSNIIVSNSKAGIKAYRPPIRKSVIIHNGFNFERTENLINKEVLRGQLGIGNCFIIGMVASFSAFKDYSTFFLAAQMILQKRQDVIFLAVGNNTDSEESKRLIAEDYLKYFRLLGKRSEVESLVNLMDICVLSTFTEGISNSILEYMALEKPVIATKGGGTDELIVDQHSGFLVKPSNPVDLAEKIEILLKDARLRIKMGKAGKIIVINDFSIENMVSKYLELYKSVLSDKPA